MIQDIHARCETPPELTQEQRLAEIFGEEKDIFANVD